MAINAPPTALISGIGGLGCPASLALAREGIHRLTLVDPDRVDRSNLHRQILYRDEDLGRLKVEVAAERLRAQFPAVEIQPLALRVDRSNAAELLRAHDVAIDGTDGVRTKFMLNDAAVRAR